MLGRRNSTRTRAASIPHAEYEIIWAMLLTEEFALDELIEDMAPDEVSEKRLKQAGRNVVQMMKNMAQSFFFIDTEYNVFYTPKEN